MEKTALELIFVKVAGWFSLFSIPALLIAIGFAIYYARKPETEETLKIGNRWLMLIDIIVVIWVVLLVCERFAI